MYITMSETFTKIDSLMKFTDWNFKRNVAYEPAKNPRYHVHCFDVMLIFPNWCPSYIPPWLVFAKHHAISSWCRIFSSRSRSRKIRILCGFWSFLLIVVTVISSLLKTAFWQTSIRSQSLVKSLYRSDKDKITFKAIEKHRFGLRKTVLKHLKMPRIILAQYAIPKKHP